MKKQAFFIFAFLVAVCANAQDTLYYGNPYYMFNPGYPNNYSVYHDEYAGGAIPGVSDYIHGQVIMQSYVAPPSMGNGQEDLAIYGVALTTVMPIPTDTPTYSVGVYERLSTYIPDTFHQHLVYGDFREVTSVWKDAHLRHCRFGYILDSTGAMSHCYEYYFDHPFQVHDTFYIGAIDKRDTLVNNDDSSFLIVYGRDLSMQQNNWWNGGVKERDSLKGLLHDDWPAAYEKRWWGGFFPIIGLRCTAPKEGEVIRVEGDSVVIQFVDDGEEHQYEVVYARDGFGVDTTAGERTAAPDSLFTFRGLEAGMRYWYRVRRSCTIGHMTVWSPWSPGYRLPNSVGIRPDMEPVALEVNPNPANEYVEVTAEVPEGSLELRDAQGRLHLAQRLEGGHARIELQGVPAGVYTLHLRSAEGNATRRVIVR